MDNYLKGKIVPFIDRDNSFILKFSDICNILMRFEYYYCIGIDIKHIYKLKRN